MRFTIYERRVRAMALEYSNVLVRAKVLRVTDPRSGGGGNPCKALGIKVRQGLSGFVRPFFIKKYFKSAATEILLTTLYIRQTR